MRVVLVMLLLSGCSPVYKYVTHSGKTPEGRMCEMQAQRARDYCKQAMGCDKDAKEDGDDKCGKCGKEYREAFVTCGGSVDKVCVESCDGTEDKKLKNQTQD